MSAPLSSVVTVSIAASSANPTKQGFNTPLIASATAAWIERTRSYSSIGAVGSDFAVTTGEYLAAAKMFAQNPAPSKIKIGRINGAKPTMTWSVTPIAVNSKKYAMQLNGRDFSYTADSSATVAEIVTGLKAAFDVAKAISPALAITSTDATTKMTVAADVAGTFFSLGTTIDGSPRNDPNITMIQDQAAPSSSATTTELNAILAADRDWYGLINLANSKAIIDEIGTWAESNKRLFVAQTQDSACINTTLSGTDDVMESTKGNALTHTAVAYSEDTGDFVDAAWMGNRLPDKPGSNTWWGAQLPTVAYGNYSDSQRANMLAKNGNNYEDVTAVGVTTPGKTASGAYIDFTVYVDYLSAQLAEGLFAVLALARKTGYDDVGISILAGVIKGQLQKDADRGALIKGTWFVTVPKSSDIPVGGTDRLARVLNAMTFYAEYDDAIQGVGLNGVLVP